MKMTTRAAVMTLALAVVTISAASPRGASQTSTASQTSAAPADSAKSTAPADSAKTAAPVDTTAAGRLVPTSSSYVRGNDVDISIGSAMNTTIDPGKGWSLTNFITTERKRYRAREMEDVNQSLGGRAVKSVAGLYAVNFDIGENYSKKKSFGLGQFGKDIVNDNKTAGLDLTLSEPLLGAKKSLLGISAEGRQGRNDFQYVHSISGGLSGSLDYSFGDILSVSGGFGTRRQRQTSDVGSVSFGTMPSNSDTLRASMGYGKGDTKVVAISYMRSSGVDRSVVPPLGNSLQILDDPSKATRERMSSSGEELSVQSAVAPFSFLAVDVQFQHKVANNEYAQQKQLSSGNESTDLTANAKYNYSTGGVVSVQVSTSKSVNDYGPTSLSNYNESRHAVSMNVSQKVSDSLSVSLGGAGYLTQRFFPKGASNPRDADILSYHGEANIKGSPIPRITTNVIMAADRYETINIDYTLSGDNRVDYQYRMGPTVTLSPAKWVSISQDYTLKIEYTDFVYTGDRNYLNRTTTLNSRANFIIFTPLRFNIRHSYLMKDTGSYLMTEGERRYNRSNENREHSLFLDMNYEVQRDFTIRAQADFRHQRGDVFGLKEGRKGIVSSSLFQSGGMRLGFLRNRNIGSAGSINLDVAYVRRYGPYITKERKEYWDVNSTVSLRF